jgi:hypothetical protein
MSFVLNCMKLSDLLLVLAAIFVIGKAVDPLIVCEKVIATFLLLTALGFGYYVLIDLQRTWAELENASRVSKGKTASYSARKNGKFLSLKNTSSLIFVAYQSWLFSL